MKLQPQTKNLIGLALLVGFAAGCSALGIGGGDSSSVQLQMAQQTLDALNAGNQGSAQGSSGNQNSATQVPATTAPEATDTSSVSQSTSQAIIYEFDDEKMAWDAGCWSIRQPMGDFGDGWNEDDHWFGANLDCEMAFDLNFDQTGTYDVFLVATYAPDFGNLTLSFQRGIEKDDFMNLSLYNADVKPTDEIPLGQWQFNPGDTNQFIVKVYGKADQSTDYKFGLDYLKLIPVQPEG